MSHADWDRSPDVDARVERLVGDLTLDEKVDLVTGDANYDYAFYNAPVVRLGIPAITMADGPAGSRVNNLSVNGGTSTRLPAPIALAATWDPDLARRYGEVIGAEALATGHLVQLGPAVDIARAPLGGRTFESFGEDPLLQARMAVAEIEGIQSRGVQATIKHFVANNQEYQRFTIDARVDERTLRELYLVPFEAAVRDGRVAAAMGAFNRINGTYACENRHTLTEILKDEWGFRGWVISDWAATQSTTASALAGLDQEQPEAAHWGPRLLAAVGSGEVPLTVLDEMVRRILRPMIGLGQIDRPVEIRPLPVEAHGRIAREIAEEAVVLLDNRAGILPLRDDGLGSIAVIGPEADNASVGGAGSAFVRAAYGVAPLDGIRRRAGDDIRVDYAPGADTLSAGVLLPGPTAVPSGVLLPADGAAGERGLRAEYWANPSFDGEPLLSRVDPLVELNLGFFNLPVFNAASEKLPPTPMELNGRISVRWTGTLAVAVSGEYRLALTSLGSARCFLDDELAIEIRDGTGIDAAAGAGPQPSTPTPPPLVPDRGPIVAEAQVRLDAAVPRALRVEYQADSAEQNQNIGAQVRLGWEPPVGAQPPLVTEAAALAARSDVAIVVAANYESEMMDRPSLRLPHDQDALIRAVAAANPRTIVVLMTGGAVETASWIDAPAAALQAWYAGQEQGNAIARVLFGDVNPSGRLPLTVPRTDDETPLRVPTQYPGVEGVVHYSEGIFTGHRGYDELGIEPGFPFGHGLSYTTFEYHDLHVAPAVPHAPGALEDYPLVATFAIQNMGDLAGTEVPQVYVGRLPAPVPTPVRRLAGWTRVSLDPGERREVRVPITRRALSYWDTAASAWVTPPGELTLSVGSSSRQLPLAATVTLG